MRIYTETATVMMHDANPAGTWRNDNAIITSKRRSDVVLT